MTAKDTLAPSSNLYTVRYVAKDLWRNISLGQEGSDSLSRLKVRQVVKAAIEQCHLLPPSKHDQSALESHPMAIGLFTSVLEDDPVSQPGSCSSPTATSQHGIIMSRNIPTAFPPSCKATVSDKFAEEYGLYVPARGHWLENERLFADYRVGSAQPSMAGEVLELQHRHHFVRTSMNQHYAEGNLFKKGERSFSWRERFFVIRHQTLHYFGKRGETQPTGTIDLSGHRGRFKLHVGDLLNKGKVSLHDGNGGSSCEFQIETTFKTYRLRAANRLEACHWIRILRQLEREQVDSPMASQLNNRRIEDSSVMAMHSPPPPPLTPLSLLSPDGYATYTSDDDDGDNESDKVKSSSTTNGTARKKKAHEASSPSEVLPTFRHLRLSDALNRAKQQQQVTPTMETAPDWNVIGPNVDIQCDKIGFLFKKGSVNKSLRYRLFVLKDKILFYYKLPSSSNTSASSATVSTAGDALRNTNYTYAGMINLEGAKITSDRKMARSKTNVFRIMTCHRKYVVSTDDASEWQDWKDAFEFICGLKVEESSAPAGAEGWQDEDESDSHSGTDDVKPRWHLSSDDDDGEEESSRDSASLLTMKAKRLALQSTSKERKLRLNFELLGEPEWEGSMLKQGNDRRRKFKKRWFMLVGRSLFYSEDKYHRTEPIGSIPLALCSLERPVAVGAPTPSSQPHLHHAGESRNRASFTSSPNHTVLTSADLALVSSTSGSTAGKYSIDLVVRNVDLNQPVLRTFHLRCEQQADYQQWMKKLCLHTNTNLNNFGLDF